MNIAVQRPSTSSLNGTNTWVVPIAALRRTRPSDIRLVFLRFPSMLHATFIVLIALVDLVAPALLTDASQLKKDNYDFVIVGGMFMTTS